MKKEILGQTDKGQTDDTTVENQGLLDLELKPEKEADIPVSKGGSTTGSQTVILDVNEFAIDIIDVNGNTVKHYDSYADLKNGGRFVASCRSLFDSGDAGRRRECRF